MAYDTQELFKTAVQEIEKKKLVFHEDVFGILGIANSTYYEHFPKESNEYKTIARMLQQNVVAIKAGIRNKWYKSKADAGGLYLYKLLGNKKERERLTVNYNKNENEQKGEIVTRNMIDISTLPDNVVDALLDAYEKSNTDTSKLGSPEGGEV